MTNERFFSSFYKVVNFFHKPRTCSVSRCSRRRLCYTISIVLFCMALTCVPSFAVSDVQVIPFYTMSKADYGGTTSIVGISNQWTSITAVTDSTYSNPLFYKLPDNLLSGQTYTVSFDFKGDDFIYQLSLYSSSTWDDYSVSNRKVYCEGSSEEHNGHIEGSFVYNGEPYLAFHFVIPPSKVIRVSPLTITRYNPNAGLESRLDEQNSKLFDGEDVSALPDDGLDSHLDGFKTKLNELISNVNNVDFLGRIKRGMLTFNILIDSFIYNGEQKPYSIKWILPLINFSLFLGVIGAVLNIVKASSRDNYNEKNDNEGKKR